MKALLEIIQVILSLFVRNKTERVTEKSLNFQVLGVDQSGETVGTTADLSDEDLDHARDQFEIDFQEEKTIMCHDHEIPIDWEDTILWTEPGALMCKSNQYKTISGNRAQSIDKIVVHWDGCLNSKQCAKVLSERGLSAHFCIDNDGTIYQTMDMNHAAWQPQNYMERFTQATWTFMMSKSKHSKSCSSHSLLFIMCL